MHRLVSWWHTDGDLGRTVVVNDMTESRARLLRVPVHTCFFLIVHAYAERLILDEGWTRDRRRFSRR